MIFVGGVPLAEDSTLSQGKDMLIALLAHPVLVSASRSFSDIPERKFSASEDASLESSKPCNLVYLFQREYATADPAHVQFVGTDEATTCVGIVIQNMKNGMTCVAHIDSRGVVDIGLTQMLLAVASPDGEDAILDVHVVGAFEDTSTLQHIDGDMNTGGGRRPPDGFSVPLCTKLVETLGKRKEIFHLKTFHVLKLNTRWDSQGNAYPIFHGLLVEVASGSISPASFDSSSRCPDEIIRRIRVIASYEDPSWNGKLLDTYETRTDKFVIAPTIWTQDIIDHALTTVKLSDQDILLTCSSSPLAEPLDFAENQRRLCEYLVQHPDWSEAFPSNKPRMFQRAAGGQWTML